jgi:DNA-binding transcriptional LysR family regulator
MNEPSHALTPEALRMIDTIARTGSFAAAARELGRVPSALTYSVRQLEEHLDVLLFDRRSRQAQFTPAGEALLKEARRLLADMGVVAQRVRRVASGWEPMLTIVVDDIIDHSTLLELCEAFFEHLGQAAGAGTQLRLRTEVLAGTWEALSTGHADLAVGVGTAMPAPSGVVCEALGTIDFTFVTGPKHPLANLQGDISDAVLLQHRAVAVADSARRIAPITVNLQPGQDVFTVASMDDKIKAIERHLGCGYVPKHRVLKQLADGRLIEGHLQRPQYAVEMGYAWRGSTRTARQGMGLALQWWLEKLSHNATRQALLQGSARGR